MADTSYPKTKSGESGVKVTICPPGKAKGAGDLHTWALRRQAGLSGLPDERAPVVKKKLKHRKAKADKFHRRAAREKCEAAGIDIPAYGVRNKDLKAALRKLGTDSAALVQVELAARAESNLAAARGELPLPEPPQPKPVKPVTATLPRTLDELMAALSEKAQAAGVPTPKRAQARAWGIPWPLQRGWMERLFAVANGGQAPPREPPRGAVLVTRARARLDREEREEREAAANRSEPRVTTGSRYVPSDDDDDRPPWDDEA